MEPEGRPVAIALDTVSQFIYFYIIFINVLPQKGPEIRTGLTRDGKDVRHFRILITPGLIKFQFPIPAGHEFIISTDTKYSEICDDKVMWVDYVTLAHCSSPFKLH